MPVSPVALLVLRQRDLLIVVIVHEVFILADTPHNDER